MGFIFLLFIGFIILIICLSKKTNEELKYIGKNIFTVQFHPEACPGPQDSAYLFDRFIEMMGGN